jgi:hypothetical protein
MTILHEGHPGTLLLSLSAYTRKVYSVDDALLQAKGDVLHLLTTTYAIPQKRVLTQTHYIIFLRSRLGHALEVSMISIILRSPKALHTS